ncbi:MAG: helix-turn-helix domain-containing protein [Candidatus Dormibacteria bacterium]
MSDSMMDASSQLRFVRARAGLSQREVARRAGTSSATLSRYESGALVPNVGTFNRLVEACLPAGRRWPSLTVLAPVVAEARRRQGSTAAWRLVGEVLDDEAVGRPADTAMVVADVPARTGDSATDALVAALAEYLTLQRGLSAPGWSQDPDRVSRPWWFVADVTAWIPTSLRESPRSFAKRGIFVTAAGLERR